MYTSPIVIIEVRIHVLLLFPITVVPGWRSVGMILHGYPHWGRCPSITAAQAPGAKSPLLLYGGPAPIPTHLARMCSERFQTSPP